MKLRTLALLALAAGFIAGVVMWRRRSSGPPAPAVQLGLAGGEVRALDPTDPATAELQELAAGVRDAFTGGA
jgi:hypothetical protein